MPGYNPRLMPLHKATGTFASIATNGSSAQFIQWTPIGSGQIFAARFVNGTTSSVASGTTAGSAMNVYVHKNAIDTAASAVGKVALAEVATLGTQNLSMSTSTTLTRFSGGEQYIGQIFGGAGNNRNNAGCYIQIDFMYAYTQDIAGGTTL